MLRRFVGFSLAAACGAALADALDDALVYRAITARAADAAVSSKRALEALGGSPIHVAPWWRSSSVSAPLRGGRGAAGSVASASFAVTGPEESGSRSADVVVLAVAARERTRRKEEVEKDENDRPASRPSQPPPPPPPLPSPFLVLRSLHRRWSQDGWTLVSADITLPRPGGAPGPATGVSLLREIEAAAAARSKSDEEEAKNDDDEKK